MTLESINGARGQNIKNSLYAGCPKTSNSQSLLITVNISQTFRSPTSKLPIIHTSCIYMFTKFYSRSCFTCNNAVFVNEKPELYYQFIFIMCMLLPHFLKVTQI